MVKTNNGDNNEEEEEEEKEEEAIFIRREMKCGLAGWRVGRGKVR